MKYKYGKPSITDDDEQRETTEVRRLAAQHGDNGFNSPPDAYWGNTIVRTNNRIDRATSGKALSISWAARVAIPGVVAIISFLIGLHYYVPEPRKEDNSLTAIVGMLASDEIDSMNVVPPDVDVSLSVPNYHGDVFELSSADIADYFLASGGVSTLMETLPSGQVDDLLIQLGSQKSHL